MEQTKIIKNNKFVRLPHWECLLIKIGYLTLIAGFLLLFYVLYLMLAPIKIWEQKSPLRIVNNGIIHQGDIVSYTYDYCKYMDIPGSVSFIIVNDDGNNILPEYKRFAGLEVGCHTATRDIVLLNETPLGKYHIHVTINYQVNELRTKVYELDSNHFQVVKQDE